MQGGWGWGLGTHMKDQQEGHSNTNSRRLMPGAPCCVACCTGHRWSHFVTVFVCFSCVPGFAV